MPHIEVLFDLLAVADAVDDPAAPVTGFRLVGKIVIFLVVWLGGASVTSWLVSLFGDPLGTQVDEYGNELPTFASGCSGCLFAICLGAGIAAAAHWL